MRRINPKHWLYVTVHAFLFVIGVVLTALGNAVISAVGVSLIAAGVAGWVIFVYVLVSDRTSEQLLLLSQAGLVRVFEGRAVRIKSEYDRRLEHATECIDVLGFGLRSLREDYAGTFSEWKRRASVRILLLDPSYPSRGTSYAAQRDREENNQLGAIASDVRAFAASLGGLMDIPKPHLFEVKLYRCLPAVNIFRVDDDLFWGPYLMGHQSRNTPTFIVHRGGTLYRRFVEHFELIWSDPTLSRPIPPEWLSRPV